MIAIPEFDRCVERATSRGAGLGAVVTGSRAGIAVVLAVLGAVIAAMTCAVAAAKDMEILNVSYDPTREFYGEYNELFARHWFEVTGQRMAVTLSNGGSGKQARAVIDGLDADVVTLCLAYDIDAISRLSHLLPSDWAAKLPDHSVPSTSVVVFLVRRGNPKGIRDWGDLVRPGVKVVTPNPKTSGGARWNHLAAYGWALRHAGGGPDAAKAFMKELYAHVPVLDAGARGSTTTFLRRGVGDALLTSESEALVVARGRSDAFEIVTPSETIQTEPPVAVVETVARRNGTEAAARAYLEFLYSEPGQELAAKWGYRPRLASVARRHAAEFRAVPVFTVDDVFGGWDRAHREHFAEGGLFDQVSRR